MLYPVLIFQILIWWAVLLLFPVYKYFISQQKHRFQDENSITVFLIQNQIKLMLLQTNKVRGARSFLEVVVPRRVNNLSTFMKSENPLSCR